MAAKRRSKLGGDITNDGKIAVVRQNYSLNKANFWPKYILIASNALNINSEKKKGGR